MDKTKAALKILIDGESSAVKTYNLFAEKANKEGYKNIAYLFSALASAEEIHIANHKNALKEEYIANIESDIPIGTTLENVKFAIDGETKESRALYPKLIKSISKESKQLYGKVAKLSMTWALKVEKEHAKLLKLALKALKNGKDIKIETIYICQVCGNIVVDNLKDKECQICGHDVEFFNRFSRDK